MTASQRCQPVSLMRSGWRGRCEGSTKDCLRLAERSNHTRAKMNSSITAEICAAPPKFPWASQVV